MGSNTVQDQGRRELWAAESSLSSRALPVAVVSLKLRQHIDVDPFVRTLQPSSNNTDQIAALRTA